MMKVQKRDNSFEEISFDKVLRRIRNLCDELKGVSADEIAQKVCSRIYDGVKTSELDELAAQMCASLITTHPDYGILASRIAISNHQKKTSPSFSETITIMYNSHDMNGDHHPLISKELFDIVNTHRDKLNSYINYDRDYYFDYFGFKTLERSYLMKVDNVVVERPQHMWMRVTLGIHGWDIKEALETYDAMSQRYFTHATPTLFNAGTPRPQMSSCYLYSPNDSIQGIYKCLTDSAMISKYAGGIGIHIHSIRASGSYIRGTNGNSTGIIPMLRVFNNTARYVNQCFTPDTIVYTQNGVKHMKDVLNEDKIVTIDGTFKKVLGIKKIIVNKEILEIKPKYAFNSVSVTKEHDIYVKRDDECLFVKAEEIQEGDMLCFSIPTYNRDVPFEEDYFRMYGIILSFAYLAVDRLNVVLDENSPLIKYVVKYLYTKDIDYVLTKKDTNTIISWDSKWDFMNIHHQDLFMIRPEYLHLPKNKTVALLQGLMNIESIDDDSISFYTKSETIAYSVRYMLLRLGILCYGLIEDSTYIIKIDKCLITDNNKIWTPIESITKKEYVGEVYDFNMEDNHNYMTDMGIVHNSGRRNGSIAVYLEPWHADVETFLDIRKNHGNEEERCRDLFTAMWIPDLFMKRVEANEDWCLMCPDQCKGLSDVYGEEFDKLYESYEKAGKYRKKIKAQQLWMAILKSQIETGTPYILYKDSANRKSNQSNLGVIKSSNLCVAPETNILTRKGYLTIKDLVDQKVEVWNGEEWSEVTVKKTNDHAELIRVATSGSKFLECTPYHKFYIKKSNEIIQLQACDLEPGDELIEWKTEGGHDIKNTVISVEHTGRYDETYCFDEPIRHMGIFNGILTGNCSEIIEYSDHTSYASCNLASLALPSYVKYDESAKPYFDFNGLHKNVQNVTRNINKIIDRTYYPVKETEINNRQHRPIGIGIQGLANVFAMMRIPFDSQDASLLNRQIFETIYHAAVSASMLISKKRSEMRDELDGLSESDSDTQQRRQDILKYLNMIPEEEALIEYRGAYSSFKGSPAYYGKLQFDLWNVSPDNGMSWDWNELKENIKKYGIRNSLLIAPMPTATTSQILGFNESFEPFTSNIYQRQTLAGEFIIVNKHLVKDLIDLGLWNGDMKNKILLGEGSIQSISEIPENIRELYKTAWELKQKVLIDQSIERGPYVCQSQSLNLFVEEPDYNKLTNMHFYSWRKGLKTGMYYLRTRPKAKITAFTIEPPKELASPKKIDEEPIMACRRNNPECEMCGS